MATRTSTRPRLLHLRIELEGEGDVWREIAIDARLRLTELSDAILIVFGWTGLGAHRFGLDNLHGGSRSPLWPDRRWEFDEAATSMLQALPPRYPVGAEWRDSDEIDEYCYDHAGASDHRVAANEWGIEDALREFGRALCFEYVCPDRDALPRQDPHGAEDELPPHHAYSPSDLADPFRRHRISLVEAPDADADADVLVLAVIYCGGAGTVDRARAEGAYGELGDPAWVFPINAELMLRFAPIAASPTQKAINLFGFSQRVLDSLWASSLVARRALRLDAFQAGTFNDVQIHRDEVLLTTNAVRATLSLAARAPGIPRSTADGLAHDLKALGFLRVAHGHLVIRASCKRFIDAAPALWAELARKLMEPTTHRDQFSRSTPPVDLLALVVDLARDGNPVRTAAFTEAAAGFGGASDFGSDSGSYPDSDGDAPSEEALRLVRMLKRTGMIDAAGRPTPTGVLFARAMLHF